MSRRMLSCLAAITSAATFTVLSLGGTATATQQAGRGSHHNEGGHSSPRGHQAGPLGHFKHLVVIYEENHSFDNLYGNWASAGGGQVQGRAAADPAHTVQVAQTGAAYRCLKQVDVNLTSPPLAPFAGCDPETVGFPTGTSTSYASHFPNAPFDITDYIAAEDRTCLPADAPSRPVNGVDKNNPPANAVPGGCTRDLVHRFYQEQYQLNGGRQNRYTTGSDAVGLTQGYYDTTELPIYTYLHSNGAPHYVIADNFFQGAFGGSFLNHQYLIAAQPPLWANAADATHSLLDANGFPNSTYPLYRPTNAIRDQALTQACGAPTTIAGFACGDWAVNTIQPLNPPNNGAAVRLPPLGTTTSDLTIGDRMSDAGINWAWYAGGWNDADAGHPDGLFQFHHQPFVYFARYAPGTTDREQHLKDETEFRADVEAGRLPQVSFVKPIGIENEHPGYASVDTGSSHLVELLKEIMAGPQAGNTLVLVTYDEYGGQWDHVSPPGLGTQGAHDEFGPGTRIPALLVARSLTRSGVDHTVYDTTSIMATIEHQFGLEPVDHPDGVVPRDRLVADLGTAVAVGRP
jgi:acid phosphatase